ncbi:hypothetical protein [Micromonospora cremea]|uniref:Uncharacterized protein n=1 Tax=Micromonospora cremea TaxID=709881 RepID=A0A1N5VFA2_9ACTN|nr:hypothetical protein [Micromonospora cremea]SIM71386.1 hypothetical protein SAMN04489832_1578 [Micromonospora cremea]
MWQPPTPAEQELWNAVVAGVRAANQTDRGQFQASVDRLLRLPHAWAHQVLKDTAGLLAEELEPGGRDQWPRLAAQIDHSETWLPRVDRELLAALLPGGHRPPFTDVPGEPEHTEHRLLLIAQLADAAQVSVGAFVDVALADIKRAEATLAGSIPHCRIGR